MATLPPLILCKSVHHGNTAKVAKAIGGELGAEIAVPEEIPYTSLQSRELVGFGSGVYYGRMHEALFDWLHGLPDAPECPRKKPSMAFFCSRHPHKSRGFFRVSVAASGGEALYPQPAKPTSPAFLFSTSGLPWLAWLWHRPLRRLLARKGFRVCGEFSCGGYDTWGPLWLTGGLNKQHPNERDLKRAEEFARGLAQKISPVDTERRFRRA